MNHFWKSMLKGFGVALLIGVLIFGCTGCKNLIGGGASDPEPFQSEHSTEWTTGQSEPGQSIVEAPIEIIVGIRNSSIRAVLGEHEDEFKRDSNQSGGVGNSHLLSEHSFIVLREDDCGDSSDPNYIGDTFSGRYVVHSWRFCNDPNSLDEETCGRKAEEEISEDRRNRDTMLLCIGTAIGVVTSTALALIYRLTMENRK